KGEGTRPTGDRVREAAFNLIGPVDGASVLDLFAGSGAMGLEALVDLPNVEVDVFSELVVEFARRWQAKAIVKGLRVISDFEWEFQMNQLNRHLAPEIETVYVMASPQVSFVSSSGVKEIAAFGGKVDELVPEPVARRLAEKFPNGRPGAPENPRE
ncbi:MAG TPA: pantetheine-phosphate adenylyltransferase, partial [Gaiellaceae bacterium]|nr:pantetheine-phosphate adenylyltransferase [Gaiellaceae bacterium]